MIPLEQGSVFRQDMHKAPTVEKPASQSLWNRAVSFDLDLVKGKVSVEKSQSLWNRAVSFDLSNKNFIHSSTSVSIPLEQGSVFRLKLPSRLSRATLGLNPFGTGQCLST